jgi:hypothetical protein
MRHPHAPRASAWRGRWGRVGARWLLGVDWSGHSLASSLAGLLDRSLSTPHCPVHTHTHTHAPADCRLHLLPRRDSTAPTATQLHDLTANPARLNTCLLACVVVVVVVRYRGNKFTSPPTANQLQEIIDGVFEREGRSAAERTPAEFSRQRSIFGILPDGRAGKVLPDGTTAGASSSNTGGGGGGGGAAKSGGGADLDVDDVLDHVAEEAKAHKVLAAAAAVAIPPASPTSARGGGGGGGGGGGSAAAAAAVALSLPEPNVVPVPKGARVQG